MDKNLLHELEVLAKSLKAGIVRSGNGLAALSNIAKLGAPALVASAPNILTELRQLEADMQKVLRAYKDLLQKAFISIPTDAAEEPE